MEMTTSALSFIEQDHTIFTLLCKLGPSIDIVAPHSYFRDKKL